MESENIMQFLQNKTILVTGATGFLAKVFVEKILRIQPNVKKLYLLLRATDADSALQRFREEILAKDLFRVLKEQKGENFESFVMEKVTIVCGDISWEDLDVKDSNLKEEMWKHIDVIVNLAATTKFDERYDLALSINTFGPLNVLNFAKKCVQLQLLLHVSTAYVCGEMEGVIEEKAFKMGETLNRNYEVDINEEKKMATAKLKELNLNGATHKQILIALQDFGVQRAKLYGWPNTYVFTKAMGEMLIQHFKGDLPMVVVRPAMVTSTYKDPFPGWIEGIKTIDTIIAGYGKGKLKTFVCNLNSIVDVIPADMVVNLMIVIMAVHANNSSNKLIYHVGSSMKNPVNYLDFRKYLFRYFTENPWKNNFGDEIKVGKGVVLSNMLMFRTFLAFRYVLPIKALKTVNFVTSNQHCKIVCDNLNRELNRVIRLVELYKTYIFFKGTFDNTNSEKLLVSINKNEMEKYALNFDTGCIDWEDYIMNTHVPGIGKYALG